MCRNSVSYVYCSLWNRHLKHTMSKSAFWNSVIFLCKELYLLVLFDRWTSCHSTCAHQKPWSNFALFASFTLLIISAGNPHPMVSHLSQDKSQLIWSLLPCGFSPLLSPSLIVPQWAWFVRWQSLLQSHGKKASTYHPCVCHTCLQWTSLPCLFT